MVFYPCSLVIGIKGKILKTKNFLRDFYNPSNNLAKFLLEYDIDITQEDVQWNCFVDKTNRAKKFDFLITKYKFLDKLTTVYIVVLKVRVSQEAPVDLKENKFRLSKD